ncbi:MAG: hypothetical protein HWE20_00200 [Gammaproteobacteria bacterium]|nr:hypothetical protein [Gammaproteobacteria bacterium]
MADNSPVQTWVNDFLNARTLESPTGAPLYSYHVTKEEFSKLPSALKQSKRSMYSPTYSRYWAAAFCIFVAEQYRRDYQRVWKWQSFEDVLNLELSATDRAEFVIKGLTFWKREIQRYARGNDYLGSLFSEGGISWKLIQSEQSGFARAVSGGLKRYYALAHSTNNLTDVIREYGVYFPKTFQTEEKYQLLASIVEALMYFAEEYDLSGSTNPSEQLNTLCPGWQSRFPLPISESNGAALVNQWLGDAAHQRRERKVKLSEANYFTCQHILRSLSPHERYATEITLAPSHIITLDGPISTSRVEMVLVEGDLPILKLGSTYGKLNSDRSELEIQLPKDPFSVERQNINQTLEVALLVSGQTLERILIRESEIPTADVPVAFELEDINRLQDLNVIGWMSVQTGADNLLLRLPNSLSNSDFEDLSVVLKTSKASFYWVKQDLDLISDETRFSIRLNQPKGKLSFQVNGQLYREKTYPTLTYLGWPTIRVVDSNGDGVTCELFRNGELINRDSTYSVAGRFEITAKGPFGELLGRKTIGVLPSGFNYTAFAETPKSPGRILLRSHLLRNPTIDTTHYTSEVNVREDVIELGVFPKDSGDARPPVDITIPSTIPKGEPFTLRIPYPREGAKISDEMGNVIKDRSLTIEQLMGKRLELTSTGQNHQQFSVTLELVNAKHKQTRAFYYQVSQRPVVVSLGALTDEVTALLSSEPRQDLTARLIIETTSRILRQLDIKRYNGQMGPDRNMPRQYNLVPEDSSSAYEYPDVSARSLADLSIEPIVLSPTAYDEHFGWRFEMTEQMLDGDPWLIYPTRGSAFKFRPSFFARDMFETVNVDEIEPATTMGEASKNFHPKLNPLAFEPVVADMATDPMNPGWDYMSATKSELSHLPLASLEAWRGIVSDSKALAFAVLRLEIDHVFAERLSNEMSVLWESIRNTDWLSAIDTYRAWMRTLVRLPEEHINAMLIERLNRLGSVIPIFEDFTEELVIGGRGLQKAPLPQMYQFWHMNLRRSHGEGTWPEILAGPLVKWINSNEAHFRWLDFSSHPPFVKAVSIVPLYLASLTLGQTTEEELGEDKDFIRYALRTLKDFDRNDWYAPIYKTVLVQYALRGNHQNDWYDN